MVDDDLRHASAIQMVMDYRNIHGDAGNLHLPPAGLLVEDAVFARTEHMLAFRCRLPTAYSLQPSDF